jgi:hypothetical protein
LAPTESEESTVSKKKKIAVTVDVNDLNSMEAKGEAYEESHGHTGLYKVRITHIRPYGSKTWIKLSRPFVEEVEQYSSLDDDFAEMFE